VSIIEKAAAKLDQNASNIKAVARKNSIEEAVIRIESSTNDNEVEQTRMQGSASNLAKLNLLKLRQLGGVTPEDKKTQIAEEFRMIKRPLITNAFNQGAGHIKNGNLIMVTSALAG